ncbi:MAG: DUF58 domain-containing protein [Acidimicrobiales bacterium]
MRLKSKTAAYVVISTVTLFAAVVWHKPELMVLGLPFAFGLVVAASRLAEPSVQLSATVARTRVVEGDPLSIELSLVATRPLGLVELAVRLGGGLGAPPGKRSASALVTGPGTYKVTIPFTAERWGGWPIGPVAWRLQDAGGFVSFEDVVAARISVRVHPRPEELRQLLDPLRTRALAGSHTARLAAEGIEFAEVRPYASSDRLRDVNWKVSSRRGGLWVNRRHPERDSDVVLLLDTFSEATLVFAVRAAVNLVTAFVGKRDRVGVVGFGGVLQWVEPSVGTRHLYRLLDMLLSSAPMVSYAWKDVSVIPPRTLPPDALVVAVSGLDDERILHVLDDLCDRGVDLAVVEIPFHEICPPGDKPAQALAYRLWALRRADRRWKLRRRGVPVVEWADGLALEAVLDELSGYRRRTGSRV